MDELNRWYMEVGLAAMQSSGGDGQVGLRLHQVLRGAGLPTPRMWLHAPIGCEPDWPGWEYLGRHVQMLGVLVGRAGAALPDELASASLGMRIRDEVLGREGVLRIQRGVQAWARKSESPG